MPPVSGVLDMSYLQSFEVVFFGQTGLEIREFGSHREALWVFGKKGYEISVIWKGIPLWAFVVGYSPDTRSVGL